MRPLTVINGFLLGSCLSICLSLAMTLVTSLIVGADQPRIRAEIRPLVFSVMIFLGLTALAALSFYGMVRGRSWRWAAQCAVLAALAAAGWYYWP